MKRSRDDIRLTKVEAAEQYKRHLNALRRQAWSASQRTTLYSYEELFGEAAGALFMRAAATYRPDRGAAFGTWLWKIVHNGLNDMMTRKDPARLAIHAEVGDDDPLAMLPDPRPSAPDWGMRWDEWKTALGAEAREVVALLTEAPTETLTLLGLSGGESPCRLRVTLRRHLTRRWSPSQVRRVFKELHVAVSAGV